MSEPEYEVLYAIASLRGRVRAAQMEKHRSAVGVANAYATAPIGVNTYVDGGRVLCGFLSGLCPHLVIKGGKLVEGEAECILFNKRLKNPAYTIYRRCDLCLAGEVDNDE